MPVCTTAFSTKKNYISTFKSSTSSSTSTSPSSLSMGPPIDNPSTPLTDLYGEGSRKHRRTVYTHDDWVKHRSSDRFVHNISTFMHSGIYKNVGRQVLATTSVAILVWFWNLLVGGYEDFAGVMHDPLISGGNKAAVGLPLTMFTTLSPSLGLLLGELLQSLWLRSMLTSHNMLTSHMPRICVYYSAVLMTISYSLFLYTQSSAQTLHTIDGMKHVNFGDSTLTTLVILTVWPRRGMATTRLPATTTSSTQNQIF